jgi:hypothetical protein
VPIVVAAGLISGSCNSNTRVKEHKVQQNDNKTEQRDRYKNDSVEVKRDKTIRYDDQGNVKKEVEKESKDKK